MHFRCVGECTQIACFRTHTHTHKHDILILNCTDTERQANIHTNKPNLLGGLGEEGVFVKPIGDEAVEGA